jgi:hypothetical protein
MKRQGLSAPIPTRTTIPDAKRRKTSETRVPGERKEEPSEETSSRHTGRSQIQEPENEKSDQSASEEHSEGSEYIEETELDEESEDADYELATLNHGRFEPSLKSWLKFMKLQLVEDDPVDSIYEGLAGAISAKSVSSGSRVISADMLNFACENIATNGNMVLEEMEKVLTSFSKATGFTVLSVLLSGETKMSKVSKLVRIHQAQVDLLTWGEHGWAGMFPKEIPWILLIVTTKNVGLELQIRKFYSASYTEQREFTQKHLTAGNNDCFLRLLGALGYYEPLLLYTKDFVLRSNENFDMDTTFPAKVVCGRYKRDWIDQVTGVHNKILRMGCYHVVQVSEETYKLYFNKKDGRGRHAQSFFTIAEMAFYLWQQYEEKWTAHLNTESVFGRNQMKMPLKTDQTLCRRRKLIVQDCKLVSVDGVWIARDKHQRIAAMNTCKDTMAFLIACAFQVRWQLTIQLEIPSNTLQQMKDTIEVHRGSSGVYCNKNPSGRIIAPNADALYQVIWDKFATSWSYFVSTSTVKTVSSSQHGTKHGTIRIGIPTNELQLMKSMIFFHTHSTAQDKVCARVEGRITYVGKNQLEVCGKIWRDLGTKWPDVIGLNTTKSKRAGKKKFRYIVEEITD